jgi:plastocyanin
MQTLWTLLSRSDIVPGSRGMKRSMEMSIRTTGILVAALAIAVSLSTVGRAQDQETSALRNAVVHFGQPQPQTPDPAPVGAAVTHFLFPNDVTIQKGGTVTFVVNGGGHGIAIHPVGEHTTRAEIAEDLCAGNTPEDPDPIVDRRNRNAVCNGAIVTGVDAIVGTQNLNYDITDGKGNLIISTGVNSPTVANPRVDDTTHTHRLLGTSGRVTACGPDQKEPACDSTAPGTNPAGGFLAGSTAVAPGNRINVRFMKTGRYLVICMNRAHSLNDHMFGFVNVVGDN